MEIFGTFTRQAGNNAHRRNTNAIQMFKTKHLYEMYQHRVSTIEIGHQTFVDNKQIHLCAWVKVSW